MSDRKGPSAQQNEPPADVAALYSWANLHGAKYRDFSAVRAQTRENVRQRVIEEERKPNRLPSATPQAESAPRSAAPALVPQSRQLPAQNPTVPAIVDEAAAARAAAAVKTEEIAQAARAAQAALAQLAAQAHEKNRQHAEPSPDWLAPAFVRQAVPPLFHPAPQRTIDQPQPDPARDAFNAPQNSWTQQDSADRPAWLTSEPAVAPSPSAQTVASPTPQDTLEGTRDRLASRWFVLKSVFDGVSAPAEPISIPVTSHAPVVAVFSLAGGVGKTSIVATLGRALAARSEKVLLVDTASFGLLPFFFGAQDQRPGQLRTFSPPSGGDASIQLVTIDADAMGTENPSTETLTSEIARYSRGTSRIIVNLATASGATTRRILKLNPLVVVPVVPDMNSVVSVASIDSFFERHANARMPHYLLNRFDASLPLHLDVREVLRDRLGDRLLPFALRHAPAVSEALADGMTVIDYAPNSAAADDFVSLAGWVKSLSAPAVGAVRGVRWSER